MKRMQAIVSGKKKQCTKLPTPSPQKSSKKSTSSSDDRKSQGATKSGLPPSGKENASKGKESSSGRKESIPKDAGRKESIPKDAGRKESIPKDAGRKESIPKDAGRKESIPKDAGSPIKAPVTSSSSLASSGSSTVTASNSSLSTISAASSARGSSKIPASSPKKSSKDGTPTKERVRLDSEGKSKAKHRSDSSSRKSSKEKQKAEQKSKTAAPAVASGDSTVKYRKNSDQIEDPGYVRRNLFTDENKQDVVSANVLDVRATAAFPSQSHPVPGQTQPISGSGRVPVDTKPQVPNNNGIGYSGVSSETLQRQDGHTAAFPRQGQQPLHGILKDPSSNLSSAHNNGSHFYGFNEHPSNAANGHNFVDNAYGRNGRPPSRNGSARSSTEHMYLHGYGSLPRSSRSTTPTAENIYSYGSLPRRSNSSTPTPQTMMFYNNGSQSWSSLSRKAESESGYPISGRDRGHNGHNYAMVNYTNKNGHGTYGQIVGNDNRPYATVNYSYQPSRPGSVPPPCTDSVDSLYGVPRPGSVPPHYYSDTESGVAYHRPPRAGSVPLGYESESSGYGVPPRSYESDSGYPTKGSLTNLRVQPGDEQYRAGPGKRPIPRRHTVGASHNRVGSKDGETERKREAFMQLLAQRYPQYADKIQGIGASPPPQAQQLEKPARSRDAHRRRTAVVNYDPHQHGNTLEYDDLGTMSDLELPSFQRGGFMRTSLPIVRSASTSLERPLGLVFLVYGDQTKKSLLPNEITTLDTVRALFVRAFPDLTLEMLESPRKKIYILDPATNIYFQLEDLAEIKDRSVLKIHETDSDEPQKVKERQEVRGRTVQMPARIQPRHGYGEVPSEFTKAQSLPPQASHTYPEMMQDQRNQWEIERRSRSRTPEPAERPRSLSAGASSRQRFSHSPDRLPTPERGPLNPIPENRQLTPGYRDQGNYYEAVGPGTHRGAYPNAIYDAPYQGYPPPSPVPPQQTYVARSTRAPPIAHPQRAVAPGPDRDVARGNNSNRHSLAFAPMSMAQGPPPDGGFQRSQSYRIPPSERDGTELLRSHSVTPADDNSRNRIEKMEQQLANLTAWVHYQKSDGSRREGVPPPRSSGSTTSDSSDTFPASSASKHKEENSPLSTIATTSTNHVVPTQGLSDIPDGYHPYSHGGSSGVSSRESTPLSAQAEVHAKIAQLKSDLHVLRRQQQLNMETMREEFMFAFNKIKKVLSAVPGAENQVNFHKRTEATSARGSYIHDRKQVNQELSDLEASVEELRTDVISRQCRVNVNDVEGMALLLSNITKSLADLKARFPEIQTQTKDVIEAEMKTAVSEEQFLKEEPGELENSLKRCKKLTGTLYTLKRLASVQDHRPPQVPNIAAGSAPVEDQKNDLLENIRALVPDHEQRVQNMEAADASRERKKKISTQQEALKFGKSLELASKNLRPPSATGGSIPESNAEDETAAKSTKKAIDGVSSSQPSQVKPAVPAKPIITSSSSSVPHSSMPVTVSSITTSNVASVKPSFSAALTTAKSSDKPTATVSAMTANVSDSINTTATKTAAIEPNIMRNGTMPSTHTSSGMATTVDGGTGAVTHTVKVGTESPTKNDADVNTYQVCGPVNPVFKFPVFNKDNSSATNSDKTRPTDFKEKLGNVEKSKPSSLKKDDAKPTESSLSRSEQPKKASVSFSETPTTISPTRKDSSSSPGSENRYSPEKGDLAIQKQAARNAFFSSLNTPPASPSMGSPTRNSISLDQGPVVTPGPGSGLVGKVTPGPTINLMLSGTASPKSPKSPGSFNIEVKSPPPGTEFTTSPLHSPSRGIPRLHPDNKAVSLDSSTSNMSQAEASGKQKKVPPPPPPRKGSRPMSGTSVSPVNGGPPDSSTQGAAQEPPQFVGGVLGQHRLSGGPLSSTPKPASQQKPMSRFEKDIASGIYANMNRPDLQNQKSSPQQMINEAKPSSSDSKSKESVTSTISKVDASIPPPPSVTLRALDRDERGSSSESTSSSSGTSMGSQQSVVSVARSSSVSVKPTASSKSKPEPPRRQSSLLAKFTGSHRDSKKMNNGNAKLNGVDL